MIQVPDVMFPALATLIERWPTPGMVHRDLLRFANFYSLLFTREQTIALLYEHVSAVYHRRVTDREIMGAVDTAYSTVKKRYRTWPLPDLELMKKVLAESDTPGINCLDTSDVKEILDHVYTGGLVCCATAPWSCRFGTWDELSETFTKYSFVVPNQMLYRNGRRTEANIRRRTTLILESDFLSLDDQWAVMGHLYNHIPFHMFVYSGGKSIHGWVDVSFLSKRDVEDVMVYACELGMDPSMANPAQLCRMPNAWRPGSSGAVQQTAMRLLA